VVKEKAKRWQFIEYVKGFNAGRRWFESLEADKSGSLHTQILYARALKELCDYCGKNPDELIDQRKQDLKSEDEAVKRSAEEILKRFYIHKARKTSRQTAATYHGIIRSFYKTNYYPLMTKTPKAVERKIRPITLEDLRKMDASADERERAIIRVMKDSGISREDLHELTYGHVRRELEAGSQFIHLNVTRKKEGINYETYIGPNAVEALKATLNIRRNQGEILTDNSPLFAKIKGEGHLTPVAISLILLRLSKRTGIKISAHRLRKFFETYMAIGKVHPLVLKYWMGHSLGSDIEARYIIPTEPDQRALYMEAYKQIDLTPKPEAEDLLRAEIKARLQAMDPLARKRFAAELATIYREHAGRLLGEPDIKKLLQEEETKSNGGSMDCDERFEQVNEKELLGYLREGWQVVHRLQNGEVIIRKG